jgi:hypothetical protein
MRRTLRTPAGRPGVARRCKNMRGLIGLIVTIVVVYLVLRFLGIL